MARHGDPRARVPSRLGSLGHPPRLRRRRATAGAPCGCRPCRRPGGRDRAARSALRHGGCHPRLEAAVAAGLVARRPRAAARRHAGRSGPPTTAIRARAPGDPPPLFERGPGFTLRTIPAPLPPDAGVAARREHRHARRHAVDAGLRPHVAAVARPLLPGRAVRCGLGGVARPVATAGGRRPQRGRPRRASSTTSSRGSHSCVRPSVSQDAMVVSGHRLASEAGARVLVQGGNIVDAAIAVSFALGVVEPDASGIGGDGMALLFLNGMREPVVIDYKDQSPIHATLTNAAIFRDGRLVGDGPAAANIPGVVAGMDHLYRRYGSGRFTWAQLMAPAITLAADGYELDEALPSTLREGRAILERWPEAARVYLPNGRVPRAGERFANPDYAATLRTLASEGAEAFYRGSIAKRIAADMEANGGIIGLEDLAQYQVIERSPVSGRFRGLQVFGAPPPVSTGTALIETLQILDRYTAAARRAGAGLARLPPPRDRGLEGARPAAPGGRPRAVAGGRGVAPRSGPRGDPVRPDRPGARAAVCRGCRRDRAGAGRAHRPRHDGVCHRRRRGQRHRPHADAVDVGRQLLRVQGPRLPLQQPPARVSHRAGRVRATAAADAVLVDERADADLRGRQRRAQAAAGRRRGRQRVDHGVGLRHHPRSRRRRARRAGGHRGAAPARRPGPRRPGRAHAARADRGSLPGGRARRPHRARAPFPADRAQGRDAVRLRGGAGVRPHDGPHRGRRRAPPLAPRGCGTR